MAKRTKKSTAPIERAPVAQKGSDNAALLMAGSFLARCTLGLALIYLAFWGFSLTMNNTRAEVLAVRGRSLIDIPGQQLIAQEYMRRAVRMAPYHPDFSMWFGSSLLRIENQKVVAENIASFNLNRLEEAHEYLERARETYSFPGLVIVKAAEAANMISTLLARQSHREDAQRLYYAQISAERYMEYRWISGRMHFEPELFYPPAIFRSFDIRRYDWALTFFDDYQLYWGDMALNDERIRPIANRSRRELGETPMMVSDLAAQAMRNPRDGRTLGELIMAARDFGQHRTVLRILDYLDQNNLMTNELREYQANLLILLNRDRRQSFEDRELEAMAYFIGDLTGEEPEIPQ